MGALLESCRRYDFQKDLEKALNRVDFFRIFHMLALGAGFDHFGVLQLGQEAEPAVLTTRLVLHDLPPGLTEAYDRRYKLSDCLLLKSLHASTVPSVWSASRDDAAALNAGTDFLAQIGFDLVACVPVHSIVGTRYVVVYFGDNDDIDRTCHVELCYNSITAFDYFYRFVLATRAGMGLTARETEILRWISHGKTASEIALIVSVSEHTINSHTATILKKLDVVNRTQMVAKAIREQIIQ
ncbi:DNA-binding transcriptional regulator, CsgD family [Rhizobium sp. 9140]|nr:DNA-binding transcriptional regulator, CsgD family [Rhizobium sp. 9140]